MGEFAKQLLESDRELAASSLSSIRSAAAIQQARANAALASGNQAEYERQSTLAKNSQAAYDSGKSKIADIDKQIADLTPQATTNPPAKDIETAKKYEDPTRVPDPATAAPSSDPANPNAPTIEQTNKSVLSAIAGSNSDDKKASRLPANIAPGAVIKNSAPVSAAWAGAKDLRVFLRVPNSYLVGPPEDEIGYPLLKDLGGIMFPYTPQITYESAAAYTAVNPVHSNYTQQFYKNSSVGNITIAGKFTVQNQKEGAIYCAIINLLRSLTKMRWGVRDINAGAPPPVCRLDAFGDYMLSNVPVVVTSVKFELPDTVDYIQVPTYKTTLVPTISSITLGLAIMYSRRETQDFNVNDFMTGQLKGQGYL
jgi:hypothetical protein